METVGRDVKCRRACPAVYQVFVSTDCEPMQISVSAGFPEAGSRRVTNKPANFFYTEWGRLLRNRNFISHPGKEEPLFFAQKQYKAGAKDAIEKQQRAVAEKEREDVSRSSYISVKILTDNQIRVWPGM